MTHGIKSTIWGVPQDVTRLADGVFQVSTASHGGIILSSKMNALVPEPARAFDGSYEEDVNWAIAWVALRRAGIDLNDPERAQDLVDKAARKVLDQWLPDMVKVLTGEDPDPKSPILLERADYQEARQKGWVTAVAAVGRSLSNSVPENMVGAILAPVHATENGPDRTRQFYALVPAETYSESRLESGLRLFEAGEYARIPFDPFRAQHDAPMDPEEAYEIASSWGSYMKAGDPGAIFYSFPPGDARPSSPEHRLALLAYTATCLGNARTRAAEQGEVEAGEGDFDYHEEVEKLERLAIFFATSEQLPEPAASEPEPLGL